MLTLCHWVIHIADTRARGLFSRKEVKSIVRMCNWPRSRHGAWKPVLRLKPPLHPLILTSRQLQYIPNNFFTEDAGIHTWDSSQSLAWYAQKWLFVSNGSAHVPYSVNTSFSSVCCFRTPQVHLVPDGAMLSLMYPKVSPFRRSHALSCAAQRNDSSNTEGAASQQRWLPVFRLSPPSMASSAVQDHTNVPFSITSSYDMC